MIMKGCRIGIIGAGNNTRLRHIPNLQAIEGVSIDVICNRSLASSSRVADEFGIPRVSGDWRAVAEDPELDALVIGTWPSLHHPVTMAALAAGKHVLCEARMAMNAAQAREMAAAARQNPGLVTQVVPAPFTLPWDSTIQRLVRENFFGDLLVIRVSYSSPGFCDRSSSMSWRQDRDESGLNTLMMGIFYESVARWIGHARAVTAQASIVVKQRLHDGEGRLKTVEVPDHVDVLADMYCGAQAHFQFSAVTGFAEHNQEIWLFGSDGTLALDLASNQLRAGKRTDEALREITVPTEEQGQWRVEEEFINAIRGIEQIRLTTFDEGVRYMEFTEAVARSHASGRKIELPLLT